ncbi:Putative ribonuclease H protein At1g65750 [Linum grandiflorum]
MIPGRVSWDCNFPKTSFSAIWRNGFTQVSQIRNLLWSLKVSAGICGNNVTSFFFKNISVSRDQLRLRVFHWIVGVRETMRVGAESFPINKPLRHEELIGWTAHHDFEVVVNTYGSVLQPSGAAAGGGILRNPPGTCRNAFASNFGVCTITRAELCATIHGLRIAWDNGYIKVNLHVDSAVVADSLIMNLQAILAILRPSASSSNSFV